MLNLLKLYDDKTKYMHILYLEEVKEAFEGAEGGVWDAAGPQNQHVQASLQLKYDQVKEYQNRFWPNKLLGEVLRLP